MDVRTREAVRRRAKGCCEHCLLPESAEEWPFHIDHVVAIVHGGSDALENLSWSCTQCNLHKGSNFASVDPMTGARVDLFNPRCDSWKEHFGFGEDGEIIGKSASGRATVRLLDMNGTPQIDLRRALIQFGEFDTH